MLLTVFGELRLFDDFVVGFSLGQGIVCRIHHKKVLTTREDDSFFVRRDTGPGHFLQWRFELGQHHKLTGFQIVLKEQGARCGRAFAGDRVFFRGLFSGLIGGCLIVLGDAFLPQDLLGFVCLRFDIGPNPNAYRLLRLPGVDDVGLHLCVRFAVSFADGLPLLFCLGLVRHIVGFGCIASGNLLDRLELIPDAQQSVFRIRKLKLNHGIVLDQFDTADRQMRGIVGREGDPCQHRRHAGAVEERHLGSGPAVHQPVSPPLPRLVGIPEPVAGLKPMGRHRHIKDKFTDLAGGPFRHQIVVRGVNRNGNRGRLRL